MPADVAVTAWHAVTAPLVDPLVGRALLDIALIGVAAGAIGTWVILYGLSYGAESVSHSLLPGLVVATLIAVPLMVGALIGAAVAAVAIVAARQVPSVERDTAIAVVVTSLFGLGVLLALTPASPPGIGGLLFGNVLGASGGDLLLGGLTAGGVAVILWATHQRLLISGFDPGAARAAGIRPGRAELAVVMISAIVVVVAVQSLGSLLVVAVVIGPAMAARELTRRVGPMMVVAAALAAAGGLIGLYVSYYVGTAAGASIVAAYVLLYLLAAAGRRLLPAPAIESPPTTPLRSPR